MKRKESPSLQRGEYVNEQLFDFYYSPSQATRQRGMCHSINGKQFTEVVFTGNTPICADAVLVEKSLPDSAAVYSQEVISQMERGYQFPVMNLLDSFPWEILGD